MIKEFDWLKYKKIYFAISITMIVICAYSLINWGLKLGIEFTGGVEAEYKYTEEVNLDKLTSKLEEKEIVISSSQKTKQSTYIFKVADLNEEKRVEFKEIMGENLEEIRFELVGPSIGPELVKKTYYAIAIAAGSILLWVAYQFKSVKYGVSAIAAMLHDTFILIGSFSLLGHFLGAEVDFLFVTAVLTTLSFSVHDTIVVYDRIREIKKKHGGSVTDIANRALTETMRRSINNSLTIAFVLASLAIIGGDTIRWFAAALLIGTILGTYSSPFVAVPLLETWENIAKKRKKE